MTEECPNIICYLTPSALPPRSSAVAPPPPPEEVLLGIASGQGVFATTASSDDESKHDEDVRILNVASISQLPHVNFDNINAEQKFTSHDAYCHSKTMMKLFSFELHERISRAVELSSYDELGDHDYFAMKSGCTELATAGARGLGSVLTMSCDPGTVNTKMLLAGWLMP